MYVCMYVQGRQKQSGCSYFGRTSFSQGEKIKVHFYKKSNKEKCLGNFGLVRLILLGYNGWRSRHMERCKIIGRPHR